MNALFFLVLKKNVYHMQVCNYIKKRLYFYTQELSNNYTVEQSKSKCRSIFPKKKKVTSFKLSQYLKT